MLFNHYKIHVFRTFFFFFKTNRWQVGKKENTEDSTSKSIWMVINRVDEGYKMRK